MKTMITGSSGLVGSALIEYLFKKGHSLECLKRNFRGNSDHFWATDMLSKKTDSCFQNIIHLAGENVAHGRWTSKRKREMLLSSTRVTPKVLLESGYKFSDQSLDAVLRHCINSQKVQPAICL